MFNELKNYNRLIVDDNGGTTFIEIQIITHYTLVSAWWIDILKLFQWTQRSLGFDRIGEEIFLKMLWQKIACYMFSGTEIFVDDSPNGQCWFNNIWFQLTEIWDILTKDDLCMKRRYLIKIEIKIWKIKFLKNRQFLPYSINFFF